MHFNGCLVVPVFDEAGHLSEVYGRKITEGVNPPLHLFLPGPHQGVWNERGIASQASGQAEVILTAALIDAMTFWCADMTHTLTPPIDTVYALAKLLTKGLQEQQAQVRLMSTTAA